MARGVDAAARGAQVGAASLGLAHRVPFRGGGGKLDLLGRIERRIGAHQDAERLLRADQVDERGGDLRVVGRHFLGGANDVEAIARSRVEAGAGVLEMVPGVVAGALVRLDEAVLRQHGHVGAGRGEGDLPAHVVGGEARDLHLLRGVRPVDPALGCDEGHDELDVSGEAIAGLDLGAGPCLDPGRIEPRGNAVPGDGGQGERPGLPQQGVGALDLGHRDLHARVPRDRTAHRFVEGDPRGWRLRTGGEGNGQEQRGGEASISCDHVSPR